MTKRAGVRRVLPLTLGWERLPKAYSVYGDVSGDILTEPVPGVLIQYDGGYLLLDTGFNPALIRDPALQRRFHPPEALVQAILPGSGDPLEEQLESLGLGLEAIAKIAVSHLHNDHAGGLRHFTNGVPVHIQRRELEYGLRSSDAERNGIFRIDFDDPTIRWQCADGEVEIVPGVTAVPTAGHTPGHQSFVVEYDASVGAGGFVFAFDAADLTENIDDEVAVGSFIDCEPEVTVDAIRRLKAIAQERGLELVPGHDPIAWPRLQHRLREEGP